MERTALTQQITKLKKEKNAIILAHNYQPPEVQDIADFVGDSLDLALKATASPADVIVFCGVDFMAEAAHILNPQKVVIHPAPDAVCPMANMVDVPGLQQLKEQHTKTPVVSYINTTAEIKAESDICCTSANGVKVVKTLKEKTVIFVPDQNLGSYIQRFLPDKTMILWPGMCMTHHNISKQEILQMHQQFPEAEIMVHPECKPEIIDIADEVLSTNGMVRHATKSPKTEFIVGTEKELCYRLGKENPTKTFHPITSAVCPNMKKITLEKILNSLQDLEPQIQLSKQIQEKAKKPLQLMMKIGRGD